MSRVAELALLFLLTAFCAAQDTTAPATAAAALVQTAGPASGAECVHACMGTARRSLADAVKLFGDEQAKQAHEAIDVSLSSVRGAVDCAVAARKGEKAAEIDIRKMVRRLDELMRSVDMEDREHLTQTISALEQQRDRLLVALFGTVADKAADRAAEKKP